MSLLPKKTLKRIQINLEIMEFLEFSEIFKTLLFWLFGCDKLKGKLISLSCFLK